MRKEGKGSKTQQGMSKGVNEWQRKSLMSNFVKKSQGESRGVTKSQIKQSLMEPKKSKGREWISFTITFKV